MSEETESRLFKGRAGYCPPIDFTPENLLEPYCDVINTVKVATAVPAVRIPSVHFPPLEVSCSCLRIDNVSGGKSPASEGPPRFDIKIKQGDDCCDPSIEYDASGFCHKPEVESKDITIDVESPNDSVDITGDLELKLKSTGEEDEACTWNLEFGGGFHFDFSCPIKIDDEEAQIPIRLVSADEMPANPDPLRVALTMSDSEDDECHPKLEVQGEIPIPVPPEPPEPPCFRMQTCTFDMPRSTMSLSITPEEMNVDDKQCTTLSMACDILNYPDDNCIPSISMNPLVLHVGSNSYESRPTITQANEIRNNLVPDSILGTMKSLREKVCNFNIVWPSIDLPCIPDVRAGGIVRFRMESGKSIGQIKLNHKDSEVCCVKVRAFVGGNQTIPAGTIFTVGSGGDEQRVSTDVEYKATPDGGNDEDDPGSVALLPAGMQRYFDFKACAPASNGNINIKKGSSISVYVPSGAENPFGPNLHSLEVLEDSSCDCVTYIALNVANAGGAGGGGGTIIIPEPKQEIELEIETEVEGGEPSDDPCVLATEMTLITYINGQEAFNMHFPEERYVPSVYTGYEWKDGCLYKLTYTTDCNDTLAGYATGERTPEREQQYCLEGGESIEVISGIKRLSGDASSTKIGFDFTTTKYKPTINDEGKLELVSDGPGKDIEGWSEDVVTCGDDSGGSSGGGE